MKLIAETILAADAASITFSSIPQTFRHLRLVVFGRCSLATSTTLAYLRMNGDAGATYDWQQLHGNAATVGAGEGFADIIRAGYISGANAPAGVASGLSATVFDYARTAWQKAVISLSGGKGNVTSGSLIVVAVSGFWRSNAAITSLTLIASGSNFVAGTVATLYGID